MKDDDQSSFEARHYLAVLWRRKYIILGTVIVIPLLVVGLSLLQHKQYEATARILVEPASSSVSVVLGLNVDTGPPDDRQVETLASFVTTPEIAKLAAAQLSPAPPLADLLGHVQATADTAANVISVTATEPTPELSQSVANAFATSFVQWRRQQQQSALGGAISTVQQQIATAALADRAALVQRQRQLVLLKALTTGDVAVGEAAQAPGSPSKPRPRRNGVLAFAAAIVLGVGLAFVRQALDVKIHSVQELESLTDLPILGEIPEFSKEERDKSRLITLEDSRGQISESYRFLRANIEFVDFNRDVKSILITSPLPTQGKSTTIANLAVSLLRADKKVAIVEGDLRRPTLHRLFDVSNSRGVSSVVAGVVKLDQAISRLTFRNKARTVTTASTAAAEQAAKEASAPAPEKAAPSELGLSLLTSGPLPPNPGEMVTSQQLSDLLTELTYTHDYVLVDAPPLLAVGDAATLASKVDGVIIVVRLDQTTRDMLDRIEEFVQRIPARSLGLVVTGVPRRSGQRAYRYQSYYQ
jgi:receptor protein-tyrosine kinase